MKKLPKKIEGRSKKSQEKFADLLIDFSKWSAIFGFGAILALLVKSPTVRSNDEIIVSFLLFGLCLFFAIHSRKQAFDIYDLLEDDGSKNSKLSIKQKSK
jgi:hypothetical protein